MSDQNLAELYSERYIADLRAIAEAVSKGVSNESVYQLACECGLDKRDVEAIYKQETA